MAVVSTAFFVLLCLMFSTPNRSDEAPNTTSHTKSLLTEQQLQSLVDDMRGNDMRLMRWNAKKYTQRRQREGGCDALPDALAVLLHHYRHHRSTTTDTTTTSSTVASSSSPPTTTIHRTTALACEYATFCVTDNPTQRSVLSKYDDDIHAAIVHYLLLPDDIDSSDGGTDNDNKNRDAQFASAKAAHLIYIASFANKINHHGFFQAGAVSTLSKVILNEASSPLQQMWASAALQNMLASYCDTEGNGRCNWKWEKDWKRAISTPSSPTSHPPELKVSSKMTVVSDGQPMRQAVVRDVDHDNSNGGGRPTLIQRLVELTCSGPVKGEMTTSDNPFVGENAQTGIHDDSANLMAWAAAGVIKNLALDADARTQLLLQGDHAQRLQTCLCRLSYSPDWLEQNKGESALHNMLPVDVCWLQNEKDPHGPLCLDELFVDTDGYTCADYDDHATVKECKATNVEGSTTAQKACCSCGGGNPDEQWSSSNAPRVEL